MTYRSDDAEKKVKKDESRVLAAVGAVLQVVVPCLDRNPEARLKSDVLEKRLKDHTIKFAGIDPLHCAYNAPGPEAPPRRQQQRQLEEPFPEQIRTESQQTRIRRTRTPIPELDEIASEDLNLSPGSQPPSARPNTSRTAVRSASPPVVSLDSFSSLHIDSDSRSLRSDTVVARSGTSRSGASRDHSIYALPLEPDMSNYPPDIPKWRHQQAFQQWDLGADNHIVVESDPKWQNATRDANEPAGIFNYVNYSTSPSSDDEGQTYQFALPPSQPPPKKGLPPVPVRHEMRGYAPGTQAPYSKYHQAPARAETSEDLATTTHPARMSSLTREEMVSRELERSRGFITRDKHPRTTALGSGRDPALSPAGRHMAEQERVYRHRI